MEGWKKMLYSKDSNVLDPRVFLTHGSIAKIYKLTIVLFCRCNSNRKKCFLMAVRNVVLYGHYLQLISEIFHPRYLAFLWKVI